MPESPAGSYAFVYEHTDIPEGLTIREWRLARAGQAAQADCLKRRARRGCRPSRCIAAVRRVGTALASGVGAALGARSTRGALR